MISFFTENASELLFKTWEHLYISFIALLFGTLIAVPLGVLLSKTKRLQKSYSRLQACCKQFLPSHCSPL